MEERKLVGSVQTVKEVSFADGLRRVASSGVIGRLSEPERAKFESVRVAEERSKEAGFVLGRQLE
ncbi:MAG: hypothetical protein PHN75_19450 [Syntrophales bacterium]|nr:hypothetical protein [Syntrophales bacterium]